MQEIEGGQNYSATIQDNQAEEQKQPLISRQGT